MGLPSRVRGRVVEPNDYMLRHLRIADGVERPNQALVVTANDALAMTSAQTMRGETGHGSEQFADFDF